MDARLNDFEIGAVLSTPIGKKTEFSWQKEKEILIISKFDGDSDIPRNQVILELPEVQGLFKFLYHQEIPVVLKENLL